MTKNILLVGVGGQGTILISKILTAGFLSLGYDVKMSEIHGMSQRGGSVTSHIRYGEKVYSPVIELGSADIIIAFEKLEAARYIGYLKKYGTVIVNDFEIDPMSVINGAFDYPADIIGELKGKVDTIVVDAHKEALTLGNPKVANVILLGYVIKQLNLTEIDWATIIRQNVKPAFIELNIKALEVGMK